MALTQSQDVSAGINATIGHYNNLRNDLKTGWVDLSSLTVPITVTYSAYANQVGVATVSINGIADIQDIFEVGDKIRMKQGGGYLYFVITAVTSTQISFTSGGIYTFANSGVTNFNLSKMASPLDWPLSSTLYVTLTDAATIDINVNVAKNFKVTLGGNRTFTISNAKIGDIISLDICGAGYTPTWFGGLTWGDGSAIQLTGGAKFDSVVFKCIAANTYYGMPATYNL
jgi:hypothetical protein